MLLLLFLSVVFQTSVSDFLLAEIPMLTRLCEERKNEFGKEDLTYWYLSGCLDAYYNVNYKLQTGMDPTQDPIKIRKHFLSD